MSKRIIWGCDTCRIEAEGTAPPPGWIEASYWDRKSEKYRRFAFCSQPCAMRWLEERYEYYNRRRAEIQQDEAIEEVIADA